jgi:hypothetical protein
MCDDESFDYVTINRAQYRRETCQEAKGPGRQPWVSMEEEHRRILREALLEGKKRPSFKDYLLSMPNVGSDSVIERTRD